jgi:hypothetical protein
MSTEQIIDNTSQTAEEILGELQEIATKVVKPRIETKNQNLLFFLFLLQEKGKESNPEEVTPDSGSSLVETLLDLIGLRDLSDADKVNQILDEIFWSQIKDYRKLLQKYVKPPKRATKKVKAEAKAEASDEPKVKKTRAPAKAKAENKANPVLDEEAVVQPPSDSEEGVKEKRKRVKKAAVEATVEATVEEPVTTDVPVSDSETKEKKKRVVKKKTEEPTTTVTEDVATVVDSEQQPVVEKKPKVQRKKREEKDKITLSYEEQDVNPISGTDATDEN